MIEEKVRQNIKEAMVDEDDLTDYEYYYGENE